MRLWKSLLVACVALAVLPARAFAVEFDAPDTFSTVTGATSLIVAAVLLVLVLQLRKVADGSAMAENVSFVVAATLCFAASVLLNWLDRFVASWLTLDQVRAGSDLLLVAAMVLFALYFARVYRAMQRFIQVPEEWKLAAAQLETGTPEAGHAEQAEAPAAVIDGGDVA